MKGRGSTNTGLWAWVIRHLPPSEQVPKGCSLALGDKTGFDLTWTLGELLTPPPQVIAPIAIIAQVVFILPLEGRLSCTDPALLF